MDCEVVEFLSIEPLEWVSPAAVARNLDVDVETVREVLDGLVREEFVDRVDGFYRLRE